MASEQTMQESTRNSRPAVKLPVMLSSSPMMNGADEPTILEIPASTPKPVAETSRGMICMLSANKGGVAPPQKPALMAMHHAATLARSEEHTSELQSHSFI